jgi:PST family polysaccharide transporter
MVVWTWAALNEVLCNYWVTQTDNLLIGKLVGSTSLGHYRLAYSMMLLPFQQVTGVIGQVMFPALSRIQRDAGLIRDVFLRANRVIGLVTIPMMCGLFVVADSFVLALFGPNWEPVVPILRILCLVGVKQPVGSTTSWLFLSQGRTDLQFRWSMVSGAVSVVAFAIGVRWGVIGVAWAFALRSWLLTYHAVSIPGSLVGLSFGAWARNLGSVSACALAMAAGVAALGALLPTGWPPGLTLAALVAAGVVLYAALALGLGIEAWRDTRDLVLEQWRARRAARASS